LHSRKTPLADDVDFGVLAERYPRSGGDIKNAVLKAAQIATVEPGPDADKRIHQRHFIQGMEEVIAAEGVMSQSLFDDLGTGMGGTDRLNEMGEELRGELALLAERFEGLERSVRKVAADQSAGRGELENRQAAFLEELHSDRRRAERMIYVLLGVALIIALAALITPWVRA
jgi:hypothetical protein